MRMEYNKLRNKIGKFYNGGQIQRFAYGGDIYTEVQKQKLHQLGYSDADIESHQANGIPYNQLLMNSPAPISNPVQEEENYDNGFDEDEYTVNGAADQSVEEDHAKFANGGNNGAAGLDKAAKGLSNFIGSLGGKTGQVGSSAVNAGIDAAMKGNGKAAVAGIIGGTAVQAMGIVDNVAMGDKNFGAQSQAIDSAVHGMSGALMSSGNPYAMAAGAALEGMNFLTKAGGETVQGYDVNIENSGFGTLGHMESSSSRDFGAMIGLGGLFRGNMEKKLAKRNEQARMALKAAEISEDVKFEQEARMNSVDNVLRNNQIALAGGIDTSLLGS